MSFEFHEEMRKRTNAFAVRIVKLSEALPHRREANRIGDQVLRSGMSVAANYRAAGRGRSRAEFISKLGIAIEEADETVFWLELLVETGIMTPKRLELLIKEAKEIRAILATSQKTARAHCA